MKRFPILTLVYLLVFCFNATAKSQLTYLFYIQHHPLLPIEITGITFQDTCEIGVGAIDLNVTGGIPPYSFAWSNGASTEDITNLVGNTNYTVTVSDANGDTQVQDFFVSNFIWIMNLHLNDFYDVVVFHNTACIGLPNGGIDFTPLTSFPFIWSWENGVMTADNLGLSGGDYDATVTLGTCLTELGTGVFIQNIPDAPSLTATPTAPTCALPNGSIDLTVTDGEPPYTILWSNGANTEDIANLAPGTYTVTVTGANGCSEVESYTLADTVPFGLTGASSPASSCTAPNGAIDLTPTPAGSYTYAWSNGAGTEDISGIPAGSYAVTATDANGCTGTASFTVDDTAQPPSLATATTATTCGLGSGGVDLTPSGGTAPYTFAWSNGATSEDLTNVPPGTYAVTATGANGCTATASATVADNAVNIGVTGTVTPNTTCNGNNGSVNITVTPTPPPVGSYTFAWSNTAATEDLSGLPPGSYTVTVSLGTCTASASFTVADQPSAPVPFATPGPDFCGGGTGSVDLQASGGAPPYTFSWSNAATTEDLYGLTAGQYAVTVTGANGCTAAYGAAVPAGDVPLQVDGATTPNTSCNAPNGSIVTSVGPPVPPPGLGYAYQWATGEQSPGLGGLGAGSYTVTVTLGTGCTASASFTVEDNGSGADTTAISATTCDPGSAGTFTQTLSGQGGCDSVVVTTVSLLASDTTEVSGTSCDISEVGIFVETLVNGNGCDSLIITNITYAAADTTNISGTSCDINEVGIFEQTLTNGDGCDSLIITTVTLLASDTTNIFGTSCDISEIGIFEQTLTNGDGCDSLIITTIAYTAADTTNIFDTSCDINDVGIFEQTLTNDNGCDSLIITNIAYAAADTTNISGTSCDINEVGIFEETLTNNNGCDSLIVTNITYAAADTTNIFGTSCDISEVGTFEQLLTNGNGCDSLIITTITYAAADTTNISGTSCDINDVGVFEETLMNGNGCDSLIITTITYAAADTTNISGTSCDINEVGVFEETLVNGNGCDSLIITTVTYAAADTTSVFDTSCDVNQVGVFEQTLVNSNGCDSLIITMITYAVADTTALFDTSCDINDVGVFEEILTNGNGCDSLIITTITYSAADTTAIYGTTCDSSGAGVFVQNLFGYLGCDSVVITAVSMLPTAETFISVTTCNPSAAGVFTENLTTWQGCDSTVTTTVSLLPSSETFLTGTTCDPAMAGVFTENLSTWQGCDSTVTTTVTLLPGATTSLTGTTCDPAMAGVFTENLTTWQGCDSTVTTTVALLPNATTSLTGTTCDPALAGVFTENLSTWQGCDSTVTTTVELTLPPTLTVAASDFGGFGESCNGASDGWAQASATGVPPFGFVWENGTQTPLVEGLPPGVYPVTVTDGNGCSSVGSVEITGPGPLSNSLTINGLGCFDDNSGAVTVAASGGVPPYLYAVNNGPFQASGTFGGLGAGAYQITVQDANGCAATDLVAINAPVQLSVELGDDVFLELGDGTVLSALVNVPLASLAQVDWTGLGNLECPGCPGQQVFPVVTTAYTVTVSDAQGCSASDGVTVFVDRRKNVYVPNAFSPDGDGINDLLLVFAKEGQVEKVNSFLVFDRWGESVFRYFDFQPNDPAFGWDGTHRGQLLDAAVFVWFAEV
ncbi:MAG: gliding motility-associated C-terminal domain-containing protein, partial [Saprospiraceae bacterium]|nr:gliding motility-associated C-terminal domain-containing protein [Saprospiraceae bacterium]MCF8312418.1 gliding motility-associated C-terminal domain-containing protein [Saprospiraceae bacterium]MCF8440585.1 gliding motility-associated C-terminal domain-containing protein [Saprospiraceae bacterium]